MVIKKIYGLIINHISSLENRLNKRFDKSNINDKNQLNNQIMNYGNRRYVGQIVVGLRDGKGIYYYISVIEKKVIVEMIKRKEKEFFILVMAIERWVIIIMVTQ